jgi:hypothetical protein
MTKLVMFAYAMFARGPRCNKFVLSDGVISETSHHM